MSQCYINIITKGTFLLVALIFANSLFAQYRGEKDCSQAGFIYDGQCSKDSTCFTDISIADPDGVGLNIVKWEWDFNTDGIIDDSSFVSGYNPCAMFPGAGTYTASLYITNDALPPCIDTFELLVTIYDAVEFALTATDVSCFGQQDASLTIEVTTGSANFNYYWTDSASPPIVNDSLVNTSIDSHVVNSLGPSIYYVTVSDANTCFDVDSVTIVQPDTIIGTLVQLDSIRCFGDSTASVAYSFTGGLAPYNVDLYDSSMILIQASTLLQDTILNLKSGKYYLIVNDSNLCSWSDSITISEPLDLSITLNIEASVACYGGNDGEISVEFNGGTSPYSIAWYDSSMGVLQQSSSVSANYDTIKALVSGKYFFELIDSFGCASLDSIVISQNDSLDVSVSIFDSVLCYGDSMASLTMGFMGGTAPYDILWSVDTGIIQSVYDTSITNDTVFDLIAGIYYYSVTDSNLCAFNDSIQITEPDSFQLSLTADTINCFGDSTGNISVDLNGGTSPYSYAWSHGPNYTNSQLTSSISSLPSGTYTSTITDANGCFVLDSVVVNQMPDLILLADGQDANCGTSDGLAWVVVTGGVVPYTYQWDSGQVNSIGDTISLLDAGVYGVTVTDSLGCLDSANVLVGDDPAPTIDSIEIKNVSCYGLSDGEVFIHITSIGGDSFFLTSPPSLIIKQDSNHFVGLGVGSYIIGIKDSSDCLSLDSFNITQPPLLLPTDTIIVDDTICENVQFMSQSGLVSGADSYGWIFSGITVSIDSFNSDSSEVYFTPLTSGSLSICVYSNDSCGSSATYCRNIIVLGAPDAPLGITGDLMVCENTSYNYSISPVAGASSYHWSFPSGTSIISGQGTTNISVLYTSGTTGGNICVQSVNYCDTSLAYCEGVIVYTFPIVPGAINGSLNVCAGDTELYYINPVSGASSYVWSYPTGCVVVGPSDQDSINIVWGSVAGQICVASSNACGVSVSSCINVLNPSIGSIGNIQSTASPPDSLCVGDIVNYFVSPVSGADVYIWDVPSNNGLSLLSTNNNTITVEVTAAFVNNTITVYAYNTCDTTAISSFSIYAGVTPIADFLFTPDVCSGDAVGFTDLSISALSWNWDFGDGLSSSIDQNPIFVYGSGGVYNVSLAVGNGGCRDTIIKQVTIYQTPVISILYDDTCALDTILFDGLTNDPGSIVSYVWDFGDNPDMGDSAFTQSPSYVYDSAGQYTIVLSVVDSNGCDAISLQYMDVYGIDVEAFQYQEIFSGQSADIYGVSNNAINYQWSPSQTLSDPAASNTIATPEVTTTYTLEVISPEGCKNQDTVTIYVDQRRQLFIPLAFTPNSDGLNDVYKVNGNGVCEIEVFIYNRYGELVFYSTDINDGWDGTHKGKMQISEEYAVMVRGVFCDGVAFGPGIPLPSNPPSNPYPGDVKIECVGSFTLFR